MGHARDIEALAFQPAGRWLATASADSMVRLWDVRSPSAEPVILAGHDRGLRALAWSPDGRWIAFSSNRDSANFRLFLLDPFVGTVLPVTRGDADDLEAAWLLELPRR